MTRYQFHSVIVAAALIALALANGNAVAEVVVADDFFYHQPTKALGTLGGFSMQDYGGGQNGPNGAWTGEWVSSGEAIITGPDYEVVEDQSLAIVGDVGLPVNFNYLQRGYDVGGLPPSSTLYFGAHMRVDAERFNQPRLWINAPLNDESQIAIGFIDGGFMAQLGLDVSDNLDEITNDGEFHSLIGKLEVNAQGNNERLTVWFDPTGPEQGPAVDIVGDVIGSLADLDGTLRMGRVDESCCGASGLVHWDNVAIGTEWDDVFNVSIPRLKLQVDPDSGATSIVNQSGADFDLKYYEIQSASGSLRVGQFAGIGGDWVKNNPTANQLTESNFAGSTLLANGNSLALGTLFDPAKAKDLVARVATSQGLLNVAMVDYSASSLLGDFNQNGVLDAADIDLLTAASASGANNVQFDLNNDQLVNVNDVIVWVKDLRKTWIGDADVNGEFTSSDFVTVFLAGKYETGEAAVWSEGDWNGDGQFGSPDFIAAFLDGGYEAGPVPAVTAVPEPASGLLAVLAAVAGLAIVRRR